MSFFDEIKSQVVSALRSSNPEAQETAQNTDLIGHVMDVVKQHGLGDMMKQFQEKGLGEVISSWIGKGSNLPISADQLKNALGPDAIAAMAAKFGIPPEQTAEILAHILPQTVDKMTPNGLLEDVPAE